MNRNAKALQTKSRNHQITAHGDNSYTVKSGTSGDSYTVHITDTGATCNCKWGQYRKWNDQRSGCSHTISVYNHIAEQEGRRVMAWASEEQAAKQHRPTIDIGNGIVLTSRAA